ncbi:hypothetical protein [Actinomadura madurae]|uniref:hypothetical protein n=1 Tax=Actinomadura madurae TaxID=1993 RepID=UPI0020D25DC3|nr:hypothetical protein [Actinomadura madurae]MCQ0015494.1 hypothetical protein [Actinomadura madurae]
MSFGHALRRAAAVPLALALLFSCLTPAARASAPARAPVTGEVRGYLDAHTHLMAYEAFGGRLMCGKPFDPAGIQVALRDCPDHAGNGALAIWENFTRHGTPFGTHDPTGWPAFKDWRPGTPAPTSRPTTRGWSGPGAPGSASSSTTWWPTASSARSTR